MALLIFPIGVVLGSLIHSPRRAAAVTGAVGVVALVAYLECSLSDTGKRVMQRIITDLGASTSVPIVKG